MSEAISWSIQLSNVTSLLISTVFNFVVNRNFTFKSAANPARSIALYFVLLSANMAISTYAISCFVDVGIPSALGKIVMMCCIMLWNFFLYKKVVFV
ncbi:GtrA family protein [Slackia piriformis]|uniref:GtrA family protein n=1 Tax=Slackia piriformis TaxID=626934 RepID=UPI00374D57CE